MVFALKMGSLGVTLFNPKFTVSDPQIDVGQNKYVLKSVDPLLRCRDYYFQLSL